MSKDTANVEDEENEKKFSIGAISSDTREEFRCKKEPSWAQILRRSLKINENKSP